jgi:signal transduction histidine kinase
MKASPSIRQRLGRALLGWVLLWSLAVSTALWLTATHEVDELLDDQLQASAEVMAALLSENGLALGRGGHAQAQAEPATVPASAGTSERFAWQVVAPGGRLQLRSSQAPTAALYATAQAGFSDASTWRVFGLPLGEDGRMLYVTQTSAERREASDEARFNAILAALAIGLLGYLWLRARVGHELAPLQSLSEWLAAHEPLEAGTQLGPPQRQELAPMHEALEALSRRLASRVARERAFSAHAAHALRTPLAGIDAQLAVALREAPAALQPRLQRVRDAAGRLQSVVTALLGLFRAGAEPQRRRIELSALADHLPTPRLTVSVEPGTLHADADLLAAALLNLLDNAQRHGATHVALSQPASDTVRVHDDGPGVSGERLQALQQALDAQDYERLPGLGLVLADAVARAHGGTLVLPKVPSGFAVDLRLPGG